MGEVEMEGEGLTHPGTDKPTRYTITQHEYDIIQRSYQRVLELSNMTDNDESYHSVNTLLEPIYEDLSAVAAGAQEVEGGAE